MQEVTLILTALATGASQGALEALKDDAKAAYTKLYGLVSRRFRGNPSAEIILAEHQADPETYAAPLAKKLTEAGREMTPNSSPWRRRSWSLSTSRARSRASTT